MPGWVDQEAMKQGSIEAARAVIDLIGPSYGPSGGHKVTDSDPPTLIRSGASVLRELDPAPTWQPYHDLATSVQAHVGDQATGAVLLAAHLVERSWRAIDDGLPLPQALDALLLARRQALATLAAHARPGDAECLRHVAPALPSPAPVLDGLAAMASEGRVELDDVDVRVQWRTRGAARQDTLEWASGLIIDLEDVPPDTRQDVRVAVVPAWTLKPRTNASYNLAHGGAGSEAEDHIRRRILERITSLGVGLVAVEGGIDEDLRGRLAARDVIVIADVAADQARQLRRATGASSPSGLAGLALDDLGVADIEPVRSRRGRHVVIRGPGAAATLLVPAMEGPLGEAVADDAERLLRACGAWWTDPRVVPGGGRWQRLLAASLRGAMDAAPDRLGLGLAACAAALEDVAAELVKNAGLDPIDVRTLGEVDDPHACVRLAVGSAFDTARQVLRIDGRFEKTVSHRDALSGGGRPGSPKGMPGDIPPLM